MSSPILEERPTRFDLAAVVAVVEAMPAIVAPAVAEGKRIRAGGQDGVTRFDVMSRFIGSRVRDARLGRLTRDEALAVARAFNRDTLEPPWPERDVEREFGALERVDTRNHDAEALVTEDRLAQILAADHGARWKHSRVSGGWRQWTGTHWAAGSGKGVVELARVVCRDAADRSAPQDRRRLLSNRTIQAVARLATSDPRMSADDMAWDAAPMLLNTPAGIVDLETGEIRPNDPEAGITRITAAGPGGACPKWKSFLATFTRGDAELAAYLEARGQAAQALATARGIPLDQAEQQVMQMEEQYRQMVEQAQQVAAETADTATSVVSTGALLAFVALLLGAVAGWLGGRSGVVHPVYADRMLPTRRVAV